MKRGQAFDTMMLVISVIVALAILGVLLSILRPLPGGFGGDPKVIMTDGLKGIQPTGYGNTNPVTANFVKNSVLDARALAVGLPIDPNQVGFYCKSTSTDFCSKNFDLGTNHERIYANADMAAFIVVCGDSSAAAGKLKYCVGVGSDGKAANDACMTDCLGTGVSRSS